MKLSELIPALLRAVVIGNADVEVRKIVSDSRHVQPGDVFVAYPGVGVDGRTFIPDAIARGAAAIVVEGDKGDKGLGEITAPFISLISPKLPVVLVPNGREALAHLSAARHGFPSRQLVVIGVTGTDGKTTTATLIRSILQTAGHETGLISTVAAYIGAHELDTGFHTTTPDAPELQNYLAQMLAAGARYAVIEATSLGLAQQRLVACDFDVAVVTNITHEHLNDHHNSFDEYRAAKSVLFKNVATSLRKPGVRKVSVLNADDSSYTYLAPIGVDGQISYGVEQPADVRAERIKHTPQGLSFVVTSPPTPIPSPLSWRNCSPGEGPGVRSGRGLRGRQVNIESALIGRYNVSNILAAMSVAYAQDVPAEAMREGVRQVKGVPGRMERIDCSQPFAAIVDFAHTPNALEQALKTARELTRENVTVVFGCAGLRDVLKRGMMGEVAGRLADKIVITAEDPRTESLDAIMQQIAEGCELAGRRQDIDYFKIGDRQEAINFAIQHASAGDLVLVAGKGHERSMCFGTTEYPWSDQEAVRKALS